MPNHTRISDKKSLGAGSPPFSILSEMKLYVKERTDDEGIAYISQRIASGPQGLEIVSLKYRVKYGKTIEELTRSVKHKEDVRIGDVIAKL